MQLNELVDLVNNTGGFVVDIWIGRRDDLNDWPKGLSPSETEKYYTRAMRNCKGNHIQKISGYTTYEKSLGGSIGKNEFNVVSYGPLLEKKKVTEKIPKTVEGTEIKGFWLWKREVLVEHIEYEDNEKEVYEEQPLSNILNTENNEIAYFVQLTIKSEIRDSKNPKLGRLSPEHPKLTIVGNQRLILNIVGFLKENPNKYMNFVKALLPQSEFPNVNRGIIDISEDFNSIVFLDAENKESFPRRDGYTKVLDHKDYDQGEKIKF